MEIMSKLENSTEYTPPSPYLEKYWLACESLLVILSILVFYLTCRLVKHAIGEESNRTGRKVLQKILLKWLCVFSSSSLFLRLCSDQFVAFYGWQNDESCFTTVTVSTVLLTMSLYSVYIFLWVRQSIFYTNDIMKKLIKPAVTYISWFTLGFMIVTGLSVGVIYNLSEVTQWVFKATNKGCMEVSVDSPEFITGIAVTCSIFFQVTLLALFVYPLYSRQMEKFRSPDQGTPNNSDKYQSSSFDGNQNNGETPDEVFHKAEIERTLRQNPRRRSSGVISPLALSDKPHFIFEEKRLLSVETDNETLPDGQRDNESKPWPQKTTIKRERATLSPMRGTQEKKRVSENRTKFFAGSHYRRAKSNSLSSENPASPVVSDSEQSASKASTLLAKYRKKSRKQDSKKQRDKERKEGGKLLALMKHYTYLMIACILTDIFAGVIQISFVLPELIYLVIYDINLSINLLCIVVTYPEWRNILVPCTPKKKEKMRNFPTVRLKRSPTPLRKKKSKDRVHQLRLEGKLAGSSRRSSGSEYESGDSSLHIQIYRPTIEKKELVGRKR